MAWCFSTRASVATVLTTHPCISQCLRVNSNNFIYRYMYLVIIIIINFMEDFNWDFRAGPKFRAMWKQMIISGNLQACSGASEEHRVTWLDLWKYLANLINKYWTCFCYQKLTHSPACSPPSNRMQVRRQPSWRICLRRGSKLALLSTVFEAMQ